MGTALEVLVAGPDATARGILARAIVARGHRVFEAGAAAVAPAVLARPTPPDVVLVDDQEHSCEALSWVTSVRRLSPASTIVFVTARVPHISAAATELGAAYVVEKPCDARSIAEALETGHTRAACHARDAAWFVDCQSPVMRPVLELAARGGARDSKVLITGESGVGKDVIARLVHGWSQRAQRRFVAVNCAGLPETLLESELFGHVRGSFTGAFRDSLGTLQLANRGTVFLDEIGEMTPRMQGLLLRFLDSGEIQPVGATDTKQVDVRVIAATNRDLPQLVREGRFREDLWYRIRVLHVHVPPLRERREDIRPLFEHFSRHLDAPLDLTDAAWACLEEYQWPGNVRELRNIVEQLAATADAGVVDEEVVRRACGLPARSDVATTREPRRVADDLFDRITTGETTFWAVCDCLRDHDIVRQDVRDLVALGLAKSRGSYRDMLRVFGVPALDYRRRLNFLNRHGCTVDFRAFRCSPG
jgi:DNA-binding NtrC family response regulator